MNRREFLNDLKNFCALYGISGILTDYAIGATSGTPQRFVSFVIKYTGGGTDKTGVGYWTTSASGVLNPIAHCAADLAIPLGLHTQFRAPMNSHASPQVSALSGSMTGFVMRETQYPTGNLRNFSNGGGKSIDVLIGEKLQATYKSKVPYLLMGNNETRQLSCTHKTSSWGAGGTVLEAHYSTNGLAREVASQLGCGAQPKAIYDRRLQAIEFVKANKQIMSSSYLIDKSKLDQMEQRLNQTNAKYLTQSAAGAGLASTCTSLGALDECVGSSGDRATFNRKMDIMYNIGITALKNNVTRALTYNLYLYEGHAHSHFLQTNGENKISLYNDTCKFYQASISSFIMKLKAQNLYNDTLIFCNAGSCSYQNVHNYENQSTYVINGGVAGIRGAINTPRPIGSLHSDILRKFGINYATFGGTDHIYGLGKPSGLLG